MKKHDEQKIIRILREADGDITIRDVCRKHQITKQTLYRWRNRYGGMDISDARRLKELERDNAQLKQIDADLALDIRILTEVNKINW